MRTGHTWRARGGAPMARFVLPVSGVAVALRQPTGAQDVLLAEHGIEDPALVLALVEQLGQANPSVDWSALPVTDIDTLILRLRQAVIGNRVLAEIMCTTASCGQRVDLSFGIDAWLAHHRPRPAGRRDWWTERAADAPGWYVLHPWGRDQTVAPDAARAGDNPAIVATHATEVPVVAGMAEGSTAATGPNGAQERARDADEVRFRLPTLADQIAADGELDAVAALAARCIRPASPPVRARLRVEAAMAMLAPPLAGPLQGRCPHCAALIAARFEARMYCLQELRDRARFVYDDIDALAERYHWSERAILTLPYARRTTYVERARQAHLG